MFSESPSKENFSICLSVVMDECVVMCLFSSCRILLLLLTFSVSVHIRHRSMSSKQEHSGSENIGLSQGSPRTKLIFFLRSF
jgi:hypothetical protein